MFGNWVSLKEPILLAKIATKTAPINVIVGGGVVVDRVTVDEAEQMLPNMNKTNKENIEALCVRLALEIPEQIYEQTTSLDALSEWFYVLKTDRYVEITTVVSEEVIAAMSTNFSAYYKAKYLVNKEQPISFNKLVSTFTLFVSLAYTFSVTTFSQRFVGFMADATKHFVGAFMNGMR